MGFARLLLRVLLGLLILLAVIGLLLPDQANVERSIDIAATPEKIFPQVNSLRAFHAWSPWSAMDPDTRYQFSGPEQGVGAEMSWASEQDNVGAGSMRISESAAPTQVVATLDFGGKGQGITTFELTPIAAQSTRVTWRFQTDFGWDLFGRYIGLMFDSMIGTSYQKGLQTLKQQVENT